MDVPLACGSLHVESEAITFLLKLLASMLVNAPINEQVFYTVKGPATIGALLQKVCATQQSLCLLFQCCVCVLCMCVVCMHVCVVCCVLCVCCVCVVLFVCCVYTHRSLPLY